jgi:hypothetical protein
MSHFLFKHDPTTFGNVRAPFYYGNGCYLEGLAQAVVPSYIVADISGNITGSYATMTGNIAAGRFIGNGALLTNITSALPPTANIDITGNVTGVSGNIGNVRIAGGNIVATSGNIGNVSFVGGQVVAPGNVNANFFIGNGSLLSGMYVLPPHANIDITGNSIGVYANVGQVIATSGNIGNVRLDGNVQAEAFYGSGLGLSGVLNVYTTEIIADIFGNITSSGTISTSGSLYGATLNGDGSNVTNIPLSSLQPGDMYRDVFGNITGNVGVFTGNLQCQTLAASNISASNISGVFNVAYSNLVSSGFNLQATTAANLFVRSGTSTMALFRTDGMAMTSNGTAVRFGLNDFDKAILTNSSDGQYASGTSAGDLILHNTKTPGRVAIASSYGIPEITTTVGNVGIRNVNPAFSLDIVGQTRMMSQTATFTGNFLSMEANVANTTSFNFLSATTNNVDPANAATVFSVNGRGDMYANSITTGNVLGVINLAYGNNVSSGFNFQAQSAANLFIRSGGTTLALLRTDGLGLVSNGVAYRFGTNNFDKGIFTNTAANTYANLTSQGDMIIHYVGGRTCIASSYGRPEFTVQNGNVGFNTTSPQLTIDINGNTRISQQNNVMTTGNVFAIEANAVTSAFNMIMLTKGIDTTVNPIFRVEASGNVYADGPYSSAGADFSEMFEYEDGNPSNEDRRGRTVVLANAGFIRVSANTDVSGNIIGVVAANPTVVGGTAWSSWTGTYLRDSFGTVLYANVEVSTPDGPVVVSQPVVNPAYDANVAYIPRERRQEWDPIAITGRVLIRPGELKHDAWRFIKTVGTLDEYLIR